MSPKLLPTHLSVHPTAFVARTAVLVGEITLGARASVWYGAVLRGDLAPVRVGADSNIQDGAVLHVDAGEEVRVGERVTVGHAAVVHAALVEEDCLIGIGARILSGAVVRRGSIVAAGAVVREGFEVPAGSLAMGVPAKVVRPIREDEARRVQENWRAYVEYAAQYAAGTIE